MTEQKPTPEDERPFVAPCRELEWNAPFQWLRLGWRDLRRAPAQSLAYGLVMVALSYAISAATWYFGNLGLYLGLLSGFVFLGPLIALTLYSISAQLEVTGTASLTKSVTDARRAVADAMVFAIILLIVFLIWARAATMVHIFFPAEEQAPIRDLLVFLGIGSAVGAMFCALIFMASAFSLPMLLDRHVDTVTAVITSVNATLRNKSAMFVWACCIGVCLVIGFLSAYLGLVILLPILGHATWHAYLETINAEEWPKRFSVNHTDS